MNTYFEIKQIKNCRRFIRNCYTLLKPIDKKLLIQLENYGYLEIQNFSSFSPLAKDSFKLKLEDILEITGVIEGKQFFITISKTDLSLVEKIEQELVDWTKNNS
ncbi:hypothetical protein ACE193_24405 [Bernardetia sp. OM2101]|uniref:hypothetical protein n=1 Tax=Bernardetia sp. OM2101 TaxID=3344876 RepID=UPI0035CEB5EC